MKFELGDGLDQAIMAVWQDELKAARNPIVKE
jgi:hypothetical protein